MFFYCYFLPGSLLFLFHLLSASAFDHKHTFTQWLLCLIIKDQLLDSRMECSLMSFRQFPAKSHSAISESFLQFLQSSYQSVRSLIENDSSRFILQFFQNQFSFFFICRKKCFKSESSGWKSGQSQGSDTGSRSRKRSYFNPRFITLISSRLLLLLQ